MFSSKLMIATLALFLVATTVDVSAKKMTKPKKMMKPKKMKKMKKSKKTKLQYRVKGTSLPNPPESGCYPGEFFDKSGKKKLGDFEDCVVSVSPTDFSVFQVETTFVPDDPNEIKFVTTCEITVTLDETVGPTYNAIERCSNLKGGIVEPQGFRGGVEMAGKVNNTDFPELTFDLLWTIVYKAPVA